jgi:hypothetical protein
MVDAGEQITHDLFVTSGMTPGSKFEVLELLDFHDRHEEKN